MDIFWDLIVKANHDAKVALPSDLVQVAGVQFLVRDSQVCHRIALVRMIKQPGQNRQGHAVLGPLSIPKTLSHAVAGVIPAQPSFFAPAFNQFR